MLTSQNRETSLKSTEFEREEIEDAFDAWACHGFTPARSSGGSTREVSRTSRMTDLSQELRRPWRAVHDRVTRRRNSPDLVDGTTKYLIKLADGRHIEAVFIPDTPRRRSAFRRKWDVRWVARLLTGKMGLVRNLSPAKSRDRSEYWLTTPPRRPRFNIVLMGMGGRFPLRSDDEGAEDSGGCARALRCIRAA